MNAAPGRRTRRSLPAPAESGSADQLKKLRRCMPPGPGATDRRRQGRDHQGVEAWKPPGKKTASILPSSDQFCQSSHYRPNPALPTGEGSTAAFGADRPPILKERPPSRAGRCGSHLGGTLILLVTTGLAVA